MPLSLPSFPSLRAADAPAAITSAVSPLSSCLPSYLANNLGTWFTLFILISLGENSGVWFHLLTGSWYFRLVKRASDCLLRARSAGVHTACNVSLPFMLTQSWPPELGECYGANLFSELLHLFLAAVFTNAHLEMSTAVFESQLCHSRAVGPWTTSFVSQSLISEVGMIITAPDLRGCCKDYVRMFVDSVWHLAALGKL